MKQTVILTAILAALTQYASADEIKDSNPVEGEGVLAPKIESRINEKFSPVEGDRFIVSLSRMNWFAALVFCTEQNAKPLSLEFGKDDIIKKQFIEFIKLYHLQSRSYWLNGNRLEDDVTFRWGLGGMPLSHTDWDKNQPDNAGGTQRCMRLFETMMWDDDDCFVINYAACQKY
ncbi:C-type lectin 37Db-like [Zeugodacus cucurbitae]|uniref:C-type lectin 37Db-like n=1 Tax=Zeugodacus cucurbitae TaxID=28588 RepID=UPI000596A56F|nr:C-type lectin 37Db-like [Zeugodacus cucurbitae]